MPRRPLLLPVALLAPAFVLAFVLALAPAAAAAAPPEISGPVTDQAGVMTTAEEREATDAIEALRQDTRVQLFAVFVDTLEGMPIDDYVDAVIERNGLGRQDALLLVAVEDRQYQLYVDSSLLTTEQVDDIAVSATEPYLADEAWADAVTATAAALDEALGGSAAPSAAPGPTTGPDTGGGAVPPGGDGGGIGAGFFGGIAIVFLGAVLVLIGLRAMLGSRLRARSSEEKDVQTGDLARRANVLLVQTDDRLREADQDADFAVAEFGDEAAGYRTALGAARADLDAAFAARQALDDDVPEDAATKAKLLGEIVARCEAAAKRVDEQEAAVEKLRTLEREAPTILARLPADIEALEARLPALRESRASLEASYAAPDWASIAGNLPEAEKRIAFAREAIAAAATDPGAAGRHARRAHTALAEATVLLDAIDRLASSLGATRAQAAAEIEAASGDIAAATAALTAGGAPADAPRRIAEAEAALSGARSALAVAPPDVLEALRLAQHANALGDEILAGIRGEREKAARAAAALESSVRAAQVAVTRTSDFIATRRNGVRHEARTRLAEAQRRLDRAVSLGPTDAATATGEAQTAQRMADEAFRLAQSDFNTWDSGGFAGGGRRGGEGELVGAILGGIIGGMLGSGRGGFGGTPWGSTGGRSTVGRSGGSWGGMLGGGSRGGGFGGFSGGGRSGGGSRGGGRF